MWEMYRKKDAGPVRTVRFLLIFATKGCIGLNGGVHTMRLQQPHQLLYSPLHAKTNCSCKSQCCNRLKDVSVLHERSCKSILCANAFRLNCRPLWLSCYVWSNSSWLLFLGSWRFHMHIMLNSFPQTNHVKDSMCTIGVANQIIAWCGEPITAWHVRMYSYSTSTLTVT